MNYHEAIKEVIDSRGRYIIYNLKAKGIVKANDQGFIEFYAFNGQLSSVLESVDHSLLEDINWEVASDADDINPCKW